MYMHLTGQVKPIALHGTVNLVADKLISGGMLDASSDSVKLELFWYRLARE
jgi:hypothetical protein